MNENDSQNRNRLTWPSSVGLVIAIALVALVARGARGAGAEAPVNAPASAQQLVALIDYVAGDYARSVDKGRIITRSEYEEQRGLLHDAEELARALPRARGGFDPIPAIRGLEAMVDRVDEGEAVSARVGQVHAALVQAYGVATAPAALPSQEHGAQLFQVACAACHGAGGKSDTDVAAHLDPHPARFDDPARMDALSPFRAFNAVSFGVQNTAMPSYEVLSDAERWDLAFYVFTLRSAPADAARAQRALSSAGLSLPLRELATSTDAEIVARLRSGRVSPEGAENALAYLRQTATYHPPAPGDLAAVRKGFANAVASYRAGEPGQAHAALLSAYLDGYEPKEPALRARDSARVAEVEDAFVQLRAAMEARAGVALVEQKLARLDALLERSEGQSQGKGARQVAFWGSLIIVLREGLEAALLVATLLAVLRRSGRGDDAKAVHAGWLLALFAGVATWYGSGRLLTASGARREVVEGLVQLVTAAFLVYASHWLLARAHAQKWIAHIQQAGRGGAAAVLGLAFLAVFREMFEVVVFYRGLLIETGGQSAMVALGAAVGAVALVAVVMGFMRVGKRLPLRPFLLGCGLLLCALSVVMVGHGVRALQEAGWIRLTPVAFPSVPTIGLYRSGEGLLAQAALVVALAASALWALASARRERAVHPDGSVHHAAR